MSAVVLDTHVVQWWSAEPDRLSAPAAELVREADELAVAAISWFELAWLARNERIVVGIPIRSWLDQLAAGSARSRSRPRSRTRRSACRARSPAIRPDRLIYATAVERGLPLVTKDRRLRKASSSLSVW